MGAEIEESSYKMQKLMEDIKSEKEKNVGLKLENELSRIELEVRRKKNNLEIDEIELRLNKTREEIKKLITSNEIDEKTKKEIIKSYILSNMKINSEILVNQSQGKLNTEQGNKIIAETLILGKELDVFDTKMDLEERKVKVQELEAEMKKRYPGIFNVTGRAAKTTMDMIVELMGRGLDKIKGQKYDEDFTNWIIQKYGL